MSSYLCNVCEGRVIVRGKEEEEGRMVEETVDFRDGEGESAVEGEEKIGRTRGGGSGLGSMLEKQSDFGSALAHIMYDGGFSDAPWPLAHQHLQRRQQLS